MYSEPMNAVARFISRWWPTALTLCVIIYATMSADPVPETELFLIPHLDKLIHAVMFGGLVGAVCFDRARAGYSISRQAMLWVCAAVCIFGGLDEIAQAFCTRARAGDILDWLADCTGVAVAFFAAPPAVRAVLRKG